ncbi:MAG TPA: aldolase [Pseudonocardiaceae bacterium]|nr:aldolase [Pseudonocardiaceae bacterium]
MTGPLTGAFADDADRRLADTDHLLSTAYPGDDGSRQPVHTVYLPADRYTVSTVHEWGSAALRAADSAGGVDRLATLIGVSDAVAEPTVHKLTHEPIEDLRLDFEDGYGNRGDDTEDADAAAAARAVHAATRTDAAPPFVGIRFKCFEAATRRRALRTLEIFLLTLADAGEIPTGLVLTLPKVSTPTQVAVMVEACETMETEMGLHPGRLTFEVQMETAPMILGADGRSPIPEMIHRSNGRISGLHYGTYDYSDSLQIAARYQSMEHPAADHAKAVMQVAAAGTGVRLSDGSTNILPVGDAAQREAAWTLHARLVRRSLERGFYQGWDLHPAQLPTRYLATYAFYQDAFADAATRLRNYTQRAKSNVLDEPATARALARFVHRGVTSGALDEHTVAAATELATAQLFDLAYPKRLPG